MRSSACSIFSLLTFSLMISCSNTSTPPENTPTTPPGEAETSATASQTPTATPGPETPTSEACPTTEPSPSPVPLNDLDADHDGWSTREGDCNDGNQDISPDASEKCNLLDDDCDGFVDEKAQVWMLPDVDGDGDGSDADGYGYLASGLESYRDVEGSVLGCPGLVEGYVDPAASVYSFDCNDHDPAINHLAVDDSADGIDQDCDQIDGQ